MKKLFITSLLAIACSFSMFSQTDKMKENATKIVTELNEKIICVDKAAELSEQQIEKLIAIHLDRLKEVKALIKNGGDNAAQKKVHGKHYKRMYSEVLLKEQKTALKEAKSKSK